MINFYKYHGAGNDFIMINNLEGDIDLKPDYIKLICDRHFGVGADGLILIEKSDNADLSRRSQAKADCFMNYYNSDGTQAEMCGNGVRCTAKFYLSQIVGSRTSNNSEIYIDTRAGIKKIICNEDDTYSVNMGIPVFEHDDFPNGVLNLEELEMECVSMGNPHAVVIVDSLNNFNIKTIGPEIENDYHFPNKINVEFVEKIDDTNYKVKVWERGCGETLACGTGACAVYAILNKLSPKQCLGPEEITLEFPGGKLYVSKNHEEIILRGPAIFVFKGEII
ncbi:MAG: diaminopimelate epimerase [Candidatus Paceibacterota bacterium]